jgi:hypothetical protein
MESAMKWGREIKEYIYMYPLFFWAGYKSRKKKDKKLPRRWRGEKKES